jgi:hypothetical protein
VTLSTRTSNTMVLSNFACFYVSHTDKRTDWYKLILPWALLWLPTTFTPILCAISLPASPGVMQKASWGTPHGPTHPFKIVHEHDWGFGMNVAIEMML